MFRKQVEFASLEARTKWLIVEGMANGKLRFIFKRNSICQSMLFERSLLERSRVGLKKVVGWFLVIQRRRRVRVLISILRGMRWSQMRRRKEMVKNQSL